MRFSYAIVTLTVLGLFASSAGAQTNKFASKPVPSAKVMSAIDMQGTATPPAGYAIKSIEVQLWEDNTILGKKFIKANIYGQWPIDDKGNQVLGSFPTTKANNSYNVVVIATFSKTGAADVYAGTKPYVVKSSK